MLSDHKLTAVTKIMSVAITSTIVLSFILVSGHPILLTATLLEGCIGHQQPSIMSRKLLPALRLEGGLPSIVLTPDHY